MYPFAIIKLGDFLSINLYDILFLLGLVAALIVFDRLCIKKKVPNSVNKFYYILSIVSIGLGVVSAMLFQSVYNWIEKGFQDFELKGMTFMGGLIGGEAKKLETHYNKKKNICGDVLQKAMTYAMAVLEVNASMGLIVAAPTAGSAGVVPGMMLALQECYRISDQRIVDALFNAGAVGYLAMRNATVAGAVGGCQAEVGIASAMAASAAVELMGGNPQQCLDAASTVLMNMLGLVCDPVGGLVEYPCQNRNAAGVANALIAAELSLSGIRQLIPFDQMLDAMYAVGKRLPAELRETALGGCAATPAACAACGLCSGN